MTGRRFAWMSAVALSAGVCSMSMAEVTGKVVFDGQAPKPKQISMKAVPDCEKLHNDPVYDEVIVVGENNELKNVVVSVKDGAKLGGAARTETVVLDQKGCVYTPHVVAVQIGQPLKAKNSDAFLHNVHGLSRDNPEFNFPQTQQGQEDPIKATQAAETYKVKCDVHPWMSAWVSVHDHPFFGVTGDNGQFAIKDLKAGKYTLVAWHERLGTQEAEVEVGADGKATKPIEFKFAPRKKAAADVIKEVKETVAVSKPAEEECEHCIKDAPAVAAKDGAKPATATPVAAK
jgi:plastocyanin